MKRYVIVPMVIGNPRLLSLKEWKRNPILQLHGLIASGTIKQLIKRGYLERTKK